MLRQERVHGVPQLTDAFAVDDAKFVNIPLFARANELDNDVLDVFRSERMQIKDAVDRQTDGFHFVHQIR
jgi:hypothetical protein